MLKHFGLITLKEHIKIQNQTSKKYLDKIDELREEIAKTEQKYKRNKDNYYKLFKENLELNKELVKKEKELTRLNQRLTTLQGIIEEHNMQIDKLQQEKAIIAWKLAGFYAKDKNEIAMD